ncbi:MAG: flagellar MS-ring protein [Rhodoferax sp.]|nr:flagellar MS-ring protein [Rhodoferax sp.]
MKSSFGRLRAVGLPALPPALAKSLLPLLLLAVGLTAVVMMLLWRGDSAYKPVFGAREKFAAADMMAVLDAEQIPYRLHPDSGQVLVPEPMLGKVRMLLAAKGVTARLPAGLELMDRNDPLGVSQFVQDVRFRRGLEGELSQSIGTLDSIEAARVHLSIAKSTSFVMSDGEKSSASVMLTMKPGRRLSPEQIAAIINLVSGSVASLDPQRVSLVDQAGNLLSSHVDLSQGFDANGGGEAARRHQDAALRNVHDLLAPVVGEANFKASVTAEVNDDRIEETIEQYGETPKVTSEAMREEQDRSQTAIGIPGSLSNRPVNAAPPPPAGGPADAANNRKNATTRQYAYDRNIRQIKRSRGRLSKLNVAVVLNSAAAPAGATGWSKDDLARIESVLRNGLGISTERGDQLVVSSLPFTLPAAPAPWWQQRDNIVDYGTPLAYGLAAILAFLLVVRPLVRSAQVRLAGTERRREGAEPGAQPLSALEGPGGSGLALPGPGMAAGNTPALSHDAMPVVPLLENYDLPPPGSPVDVMVNHLRVLAAKEPERVAEVVKQWVQKHGRTE